MSTRKSRRKSGSSDDKEKANVGEKKNPVIEEDPPANADDDKNDPQQPIISSESDQDNTEDDDKNNKNLEDVRPEATEQAPSTLTARGGGSRLFSPYRSLGIVSSGPFHLLPHQNSSNAMIASAIGERFHLLQCDRLHPVLVSQAVPGIASKHNKETGPQEISKIISDATLSISVVVHGKTSKKSPRHVTMYKRTQPMATEAICPSKKWSICDLIHLGRMQTKMSGEKEGKEENAVLCAAILTHEKDLEEDNVLMVGDDDSSIESGGFDSDDSSSDDDDSDSDDDENGDQSDDSDCRGQVVLLVATRTTLSVQKRIKLKDVSSFTPSVAIHPSTYVNKILIGGSSQGKEMLVLLNVRSGKLIHKFKCLPRSAFSEVTTLKQSPAIDTIAVGTSKGMVHLINTRMDKLLFSLRHRTRGGQPVSITSMSFRTDGAALQYRIAPMAVGRADGTITIWDLTPPEEDEDDKEGGSVPLGRAMLTELEHLHSPGGVASLEYLPQEPLLISTGTRSNAVYMHIFDNPDHSGRILRHRKGHIFPPTHIRYLHPGAGAGGGVLVNAADGTDAAACQILSSGSKDRELRLFSTVRSVLDKEYSQGRGLEKRAKTLGMESKAELLLPPVTSTASSEARSRDWGDIVTIHKDHAFAYVWSSKRGAQSGPVLRQDDWNVSAMKRQPPESCHATSVAISACGNFAMVGTKGGVIYRYNVQSGNTRGTYPPQPKSEKNRRKRLVAGDINRTVKTLEKKMKISNRAANMDKRDQDVIEQARNEQAKNAKVKDASHEGFSVTGIAVDSLNKTLISVGSDAKLVLWNFSTHAPHKRSPYKLPAAATKMCHVRDSNLAAIALEDYTALLFDCSTLTIVRRFGGGTSSPCHTANINDLGFSPDGRTLFTSSFDGTIRVWDVPTNSCVDWLGFSTPPTSMTVSPTGEFLATTHVGKVGISLWSDRSFYQTVHVDGAQQLSSPARMDDPVPLAEVESTGEGDEYRPRQASTTASTAVPETDTEKKKDGEAAIPKEEGLITMSDLPPAHWKNLFHLELVKQRNKPKEAPKKPESAPFFLQWRSGENMGRDSSTQPNQTATTAEEANDDEEWNAAWSDEGEDQNEQTEEASLGAKRGLPSGESESNDIPSKKQKTTRISHYRSNLATLLSECAQKRSEPGTRKFQDVTDHIATLGPSAIDVSFSTLCSGAHDLEDGLPLLHFACLWLLEACESRERFDAVNAYLHRFLYIHSAVLAGIENNFSGRKSQEEMDEETDEEAKNRAAQRKSHLELLECVAKLKKVQREASEALQGKMQNTLCLLRHFSRMV